MKVKHPNTKLCYFLNKVLMMRKYRNTYVCYCKHAVGGKTRWLSTDNQHHPFRLPINKN